MNKVVYNLAVAAINEGVGKGYFGIRQGQDATIPKNNSMIDYVFFLNDVPCDAQVTRISEFDVAFQIFVQPILPAHMLPHSDFLCTFWLQRGYDDVMQIDTARVHPTSATTTECINSIRDAVIEPSGYSIIWT